MRVEVNLCLMQTFFQEIKRWTGEVNISEVSSLNAKHYIKEIANLAQSVAMRFLSDIKDGRTETALGLYDVALKIIVGNYSLTNYWVHSVSEIESYATETVRYIFNCENNLRSCGCI